MVDTIDKLCAHYTELRDLCTIGMYQNCQIQEIARNEVLEILVTSFDVVPVVLVAEERILYSLLLLS